MEYFIYMTNECNLNCQYCSVMIDCKENNLPVKPTYTHMDLVQFIKQTQNYNRDSNVSIYFFGGEPSLEFEQIKNMILTLKCELQIYNLNFVLHTNGLLLNEIPDDILKALSLIMLSVNYEKIPKFNLANSYFSTIVNNTIQTKIKRNIPMIARLTITEKTSLYTEILQISNYFDLVYWQIENCTEFKNFEEFYSTYTFEVKLTFSYWLKYLSKGIMLKLVPFMAVLKFLFFHDRNGNEFACGYGKSMVYIQTDGDCYTCSDSVESGTHSIGSIKDGITLPYPTLNNFICCNCKFKSICMGRCGRMHVEFSKEHIKQYCALNQYMFNLFLSREDELKEIINSNSTLKEELESWLLDYTEFTP